jgi:Tfp pilus assembly protein PilF
MLQSLFYSVLSPQSAALIIIGLLPFLTSACLTSRSAKAPAFRGLTASEADRLESQKDNIWQKPLAAKSEKDDSPENLAEMAEIFLKNGDYEKSIYNYSKIVLESPERHDIRYKLGLTLLLAGNLEEAKKKLAEVLLHKMDMVEAHDALGIVFLQEKKLLPAQQEFRSALALDPRRYQSHYFLGETFIRSKQYSQALPEFKAALEINPRNAGVMSAIGWTHYNLKDYDQSLQWLKKAKASDPDNPKLNHRLGMVLAEQKKFPEALQAFRRAGDEAQALNNIGVYYYLDHRYNEAVQCFQKALDARPTFYQEAKVNLDKSLAKLQEEPPQDDGVGHHTDKTASLHRNHTAAKEMSE